VTGDLPAPSGVWRYAGAGAQRDVPLKLLEGEPALALVAHARGACRLMSLEMRWTVGRGSAYGPE
jgi:hypothetical protein